MIPPDALNWSEIDVKTVSGLAHQAIVAAASERRADLVVVGLPRRSRMEEFVAGSTVHRVLRRTTSPVLLVPGPPTASLVRPANEHEDQFALPHPGWSRAAKPPRRVNKRPGANERTCRHHNTKRTYEPITGRAR